MTSPDQPTSLTGRRRRSRSAAATDVFVVDGTAVAPRTGPVPSMTALLAVVADLRRQHPGATTALVVDAAFPHRLAPRERRAFDRALLAGQVVTPPAGCVGKVAAFIDAIVARSNATVVTTEPVARHERSLDAVRVGRHWMFRPVAAAGLAQAS